MCKRSNFEVEEMTFLEQNQIQMFTVNRQKESKKKTKKKPANNNNNNNTASSMDESDIVLKKYKLLGNADSMDEES